MSHVTQGRRHQAAPTSRVARDTVAPEHDGLSLDTAAASVLALQRLAGNQAIGQLPDQV